MLKTLALVALGGALGSVARYLVGLAVTFPFGTLAVNVIGSAAIGVLWASQTDKTGAAMVFLMFGVLGGFTTFSSFSLDVLRLLGDGRFVAAGAYACASFFVSIYACYLGFIFASRGIA